MFPGQIARKKRSTPALTLRHQTEKRWHISPFVQHREPEFQAADSTKPHSPTQYSSPDLGRFTQDAAATTCTACGPGAFHVSKSLRKANETASSHSICRNSSRLQDGPSHPPGLPSDRFSARSRPNRPLVDHYAVWSKVREAGQDLSESTTDECRPSGGAPNQLAGAIRPIRRNELVRLINRTAKTVISLLLYCRHRTSSQYGDQSEQWAPQDRSVRT